MSSLNSYVIPSADVTTHPLCHDSTLMSPPYSYVINQQPELLPVVQESMACTTCTPTRRTSGIAAVGFVERDVERVRRQVHRHSQQLQYEVRQQRLIVVQIAGHEQPSKSASQNLDDSP